MNNKISKLDIEIQNLFKELEDKYGYKFDIFNLKTKKDKLKYFMLNENYSSFEKFKFDILEKFELFENLLTLFSVSVTSFFRDPLSLKILKDEILINLNSYSHIKIWCAGCSSGEEAYSIAIILNELGMLQKSQIYATDYNKFIIKEAQNGLYHIDKLKESKNNYLNINGIYNFENYIDINSKNFKIKNFLKEKILFLEHNLINEKVLSEFQLILCRNVLIYFNDSLQNRVLKTFYNSLDSNGFLILDKSEKYLNNSIKKYFKNYKESILKPMWRRDFG